MALNAKIVRLVSSVYVFELAEAGDYTLRVVPQDVDGGRILRAIMTRQPEDTHVFYWSFPLAEGDHEESCQNFEAEANSLHRIEYDGKALTFIPNIDG